MPTGVSETKYHFICYARRRRNSLDWNFFNTLTDIAPLDWRADQKKLEGSGNEVQIISWTRIDKETYEQYQGV